MSVTVLTPSNTQRLTTLQAVMAEITLEDQLLFAESLIDQASAAIARECHTIFAQQAYREVQLAEWNTRSLILRFRPLVSVQSISTIDAVLDDYRIESTEAAMVYRQAGWRLFGGAEWQIDYQSGYILPEQLNPVDPLGPTLRQQAPDLERATIECIKVWFNERLVDQRIQSQTLGDQRIDYGIQALRRGIPALSMDLLAPWRRMVLA